MDKENQKFGVSYPGPVPSPTPTMQGVTTEELTKQKLQAEIANLTKPIYKRIEFWQFASTFTIAVLTYFLLWFNGAFDAKTKYLEIRHNTLEKDIEKFTLDTIGYAKQRLALQQENRVLRDKVDSATNQYAEVRKLTKKLLDSIGKNSFRLPNDFIKILPIQSSKKGK